MAFGNHMYLIFHAFVIDAMLQQIVLFINNDNTNDTGFSRWPAQMTFELRLSSVAPHNIPFSCFTTFGQYHIFVLSSFDRLNQLHF